jgi:hypothetical protein
MITFYQLCDHLSNIFNELIQNGEGLWFGGRKYKLIMQKDAGRYQKPKREGNTVTRFLNAYAHIINQQNDTSVDGTTNSVYQLQIDIAVPIDDIKTNLDMTGTVMSDIEQVRAILDAYLAANTNAFMLDDDGGVYSYTQKSSVGRSVERGNLPYIGDAVIFSIFTNWTFIQNGSPSRLITATLDGEPLPYASIAINREAATEMAIPSNSVTPDAKALATGTTLSVTLQMPTKLGGACQIFTRALLEGTTNVAHVLTLSLPLSYEVDGEEISANFVTKSYYVLIKTNGYAGEYSLNTTTSVTLVEINLNNESTTFSAYAQAHPIT